MSKGAGDDRHNVLVLAPEEKLQSSESMRHELCPPWDVACINASSSRTVLRPGNKGQIPTGEGVEFSAGKTQVNSPTETHQCWH